MSFIFYMLGFISGIFITIPLHILYFRKKSIYGCIDVDSRTQQCKIHISREDLDNPKNKQVIFTINHGSRIPRQFNNSRDERPL